MTSLGSDNRDTGLGGWARRIAVALLILTSAILVGVVPAAAQRPNGAGLIIRHGDGTVIQAYVQFEDDSLTSEELLYRSGLDVVLSPFGGLGSAVCSIRGEGCPADNCFCQSYSNPAFFWHFYIQSGGGWVEQIQGPSSRLISDGDVDAWAWTSGESGLPSVTIDDIAAINDVDRNAPDPTPTPSPTATATATATLEPEPPTSTPEPTATFTPIVIATMTATPATIAISPTEPLPSTPTATPTPAAQGAIASTPSPVSEATTTTTRAATTATASATPTSSNESTSQPSPRSTTATTAATTFPTITPSPDVTTVAVVIPPDGTPVPLEVGNGDDDGTSGGLLVFGGMIAVAAAAGVVVMLRRQVTT